VGDIPLNLQVFVLALIPLLSGAVPGDGRMPMGALSLLGIGEPISREFMVGTWKYSDEFFRWGITDKEKAAVKPFHGRAFMSLSQEGTVKMVNLFRPTEARWEVSDEGIVMYDPARSERIAQVLPVRKRDQNRIWLLLPFTGGASGIGMVRVPEEALSQTQPSRVETPTKRKKHQESLDPFRPRRQPDAEDSQRPEPEF
jgi:hypothetical protein